MEGYQRHGEKPCLIKLEIEFHIVSQFKHGWLMGVDAINDFGIDFMMSKGRAGTEEFSYDIDCGYTKFKSVLVRLRESITIAGRTCHAIPIKSQMKPGADYIFTPSQFMCEGGPLIPSISLPYAIMDSGMWMIMFQNS